MLEFNKEHKKGNVKEAIGQFSFKEIVAIAGASIVFGTGIVAMFSPKPFKGYDLINDARDAMEQSDLVTDKNAMDVAELMDYYESIEYANELTNSRYKYQNYEIKDDKLNPTVDEFKESVESVLKDLSVIESTDWYSDKTAAEIDNTRKMAYDDLNSNYNVILAYITANRYIFFLLTAILVFSFIFRHITLYSKYDVILAYMKKNQDKDFDNYFDTVFNYKINESFKQLGIKNVTLNGVEMITKENDFGQDEYKEYALLDLTVDGKHMEFQASGHLYDLLSSRYSEESVSNLANNQGKSSSYRFINKVLYQEYDFNMERGTLVTKEEKEAGKKVLGSLGVLGLVSIIVICKEYAPKLSEEDEKSIRNK